MAIVGQSGSGKSTLMNILGCLDTPQKGSYYLNGNDVFNAKESKLSQIRNKEIDEEYKREIILIIII